MIFCYSCRFQISTRIPSDQLFPYSESLKDARFCQQSPRMTHFIKDSSSMRGIIKEFDISPDGRIIASPYDSTVRLLAFDEQVDYFKELQKFFFI